MAEVEHGSRIYIDGCVSHRPMEGTPLRDALQAIRRDHGFFIAIDSDGCVFDTMELKHKECFCPVTIQHYGLQPVSRYARQAWEFVNLYSSQRGINRFPALVSVLDLLRERAVVRGRGVRVPILPELRMWIKEEERLGHPALEDRAAASDELAWVLEWSQRVNKSVRGMVRGVGPFVGVVAALEHAAANADMIVCSGTPQGALQREWEEHGIRKFVKAIGSQECGSKTDHLVLSSASHYPPERMLMIGDAPGDWNAARAVGANFFPIVPGQEEASWQQLLREGLGRFFAGTFGGSYQDTLVADHMRALPSMPPWMQATAPERL